MAWLLLFSAPMDQFKALARLWGVYLSFILFLLVEVVAIYYLYKLFGLVR